MVYSSKIKKIVEISNIIFRKYMPLSQAVVAVYTATPLFTGRWPKNGYRRIHEDKLYVDVLKNKWI